MADQEVGRWACTKCGRLLVAVGVRREKFPGTGAVLGPCPWECGAWITRAFRHVRPGEVRAVRADDWDSRASAVTG